MNQKLEQEPAKSSGHEEPRFSLPLPNHQQTAYDRLLVVFGNDYLEAEAHMLSLAEQAKQGFPESTVVRSYLDFISQAETTGQTIKDIDLAFFIHLPDLISQKQVALTTAKRRAAVATFLANSKLTRKENSAIYIKVQGAEFKGDETEDIEKHQQDLGLYRLK